MRTPLAHRARAELAAVAALATLAPLPAAAQLDQKCAMKLAASVAGEPSVDSARYASQAALVETLLGGDHFMTLFAGFINGRFNRGASMTAEEDAVYYVVRHVLANRLPWSQIYLGEFGWSGPTGYPKIDPDPEGVGYFTAPSWVRRYAGNDIDGYMLLAAYRVVQNTTGIVLVPSPFNADTHSDATGRQRQPCRSCHLDGPLALDTIAGYFPRRTGFGSAMRLTPPANPPAQVAGRQVTSLQSTLRALLATDDYLFWTCRTLFEFAYGRPESTCEAAVFDRCTAALARTDDIRAALTEILVDPAFCGSAP